MWVVHEVYMHEAVSQRYQTNLGNRMPYYPKWVADMRCCTFYPHSFHKSNLLLLARGVGTSLPNSYRFRVTDSTDSTASRGEAGAWGWINQYNPIPLVIFTAGICSSYIWIWQSPKPGMFSMWLWSRVLVIFLPFKNLPRS